MASHEHQERILAYIDRGKKEGAPVAHDGGRVTDRSGYYVSPTVFDEVSPDMVIAREEIFGPVLGLITVSGLDEAVAVARDTQSACTRRSSPATSARRSKWRGRSPAARSR